MKSLFKRRGGFGPRDTMAISNTWAEAYYEGRDGYNMGAFPFENPYEIGTAEDDGWECGWNCAEADDND